MVKKGYQMIMQKYKGKKKHTHTNQYLTDMSVSIATKIRKQTHREMTLNCLRSSQAERQASNACMSEYLCTARTSFSVVLNSLSFS